MNKNLNRICAMLCIFLTIIGYCPTKIRAEEYEGKEEVTYYSLNDAQKVAEKHILNTIEIAEDTEWDNTFQFKTRKAIFNSENEIEAFYFQIVDSDGHNKGYIITGATNNETPIIEYSDSGEGYINEAVSYLKNQNMNEEANYKVYRNDQNIYACKVYDDYATKLIDITNSNCQELSEDDFEKCSKNTNDYGYLWEMYLDEGKYTKSSCPPDDGSTIYDPYLYEDGYMYSSSYSLSVNNVNFKAMIDFSNGSVCSPTAAVNLCIYWANYNPNIYGDLILNGSYRNTFDKMFNLMYTDLEDGTSDINIPGAYMQYFSDLGLTCWASLHYHTNNGQDIVNEIANGRPVHLLMYNHNKYGDHSVLAVGYQKYKYNDYDSIYIRIVDGWSRTPNRYVWGMCYGTWDYVSVSV